MSLFKKKKYRPPIEGAYHSVYRTGIKHPYGGEHPIPGTKLPPKKKTDSKTSMKTLGNISQRIENVQKNLATAFPGIASGQWEKTYLGIEPTKKPSVKKTASEARQIIHVHVHTAEKKASEPVKKLKEWWEV